MNNFTVEEINLMCVFDAKGRTELIEDIGRVLPHLDDKDMEELTEEAMECAEEYIRRRGGVFA